MRCGSWLLFLGLGAVPLTAVEGQRADSLYVVLLWGPEDASPLAAPEHEVRWIHNGVIVRNDTLATYADSVLVPAPTVGKPDTVVAAVWPHHGGTSVRRMFVLDATALRARHGGTLPTSVSRDVRGGRGAGGSMGRGRGSPPPTNPTLALDFDDPSDLGVNCGGSPCPFPDGAYRKHSYLPEGGVDGSGAINMHWQTGMPIGFSPVWINAPLTRHFKLRYVVRQTAVMEHGGSAVKLMRMRSGNAQVGMLESQHGQLIWFWDHWYQGALAASVGIGVSQAVLADGKWHVYEIEVDYRDIQRLTVHFWFDGIPARSVTWTATRDLMTEPLVLSPFAEMYSCGGSNCGGTINTGDYVVDDFSITILTPEPTGAAEESP